MPELPEVESVRRRIAPSLVRARIQSVDVRRADLRKPFPRNFAGRLTGTTVAALSRRGKYLLARLSSRETLLVHLGMSGWIRVVDERRNRQRASINGHNTPHDHVVLHMSSGKAVVYNDPRRFGVMELIPDGSLEDHPALRRLGPEPLSAEFDAAALAAACRGRKTSLKAALMDQHVVAGLGNIYASEALHVAGLSPGRPASILVTPAGAPRDTARRLSAAIKLVLERAIARQAGRAYRGEPFLVYDRHGEPCPKRACRGTIRRRIQGGRSTFYCPVCQR
jgi:formamidopyrimidine-DNA glycosylase